MGDYDSDYDDWQDKKEAQLNTTIVVAAAIGLIIGLYLGYQAHGIGGAIVWGIGGAVIAPAIVFIAGAVLGIVIILVIIILILMMISSLWNVQLPAQIPFGVSQTTPVPTSTPWPAPTPLISLGTERADKISWSPDGRYIAIVQEGKDLRIRSTGSWKELTVLSFDDGISNIAFNPTGTILGVRFDSNKICMYDVMKQWQQKLCFDGEYSKFAISSNGERIIQNGPISLQALSGDATYSVRVRSLGTGNILQEIRGYTFYRSTTQPQFVVLRDAGRDGHSSGKYAIWDFSSNRSYVELSALGAEVWNSEVDVSYDGRFIATWMAKGKKGVQIWDGWSGTRLASLSTGLSDRPQFSFSPTTNALAIQMNAGIGVWDINSFSLLREMEKCESAQVSPVFSHDGRFVAAHNTLGVTCVWEVDSGRIIAHLRGSSPAWFGANLEFDRSQRYLYTDEQIWEWKSETLILF